MEIKPGNFHWSSPEDYKNMKKIEKGNIITIDGDPVLVSDVEDNYIYWKDLDDKRVSGISSMIKKNRKETCWDCYEETDEGVRHSSNCKSCNGTGTRIVEYGGLDNVKILAKDKREYKTKQLKKQLKKLSKKYKVLVKKNKSNKKKF